MRPQDQLTKAQFAQKFGLREASLGNLSEDKLNLIRNTSKQENFSNLIKLDTTTMETAKKTMDQALDNIDDHKEKNNARIAEINQILGAKPDARANLTKIELLKTELVQRTVDDYYLTQATNEIYIKVDLFNKYDIPVKYFNDMSAAYLQTLDTQSVNQQLSQDAVNEKIAKYQSLFESDDKKYDQTTDKAQRAVIAQEVAREKTILGKLVDLAKKLLGIKSEQQPQASQPRSNVNDSTSRVLNQQAQSYQQQSPPKQQATQQQKQAPKVVERTAQQLLEDGKDKLEKSDDMYSQEESYGGTFQGSDHSESEAIRKSAVEDIAAAFKKGLPEAGKLLQKVDSEKYAEMTKPKPEQTTKQEAKKEEVKYIDDSEASSYQSSFKGGPK